jgi:hypothetical protein
VFSEYPAQLTAAGEEFRATTRMRGRKRHYLCPKCGAPFVRVHRRFADRLLSVFNPVRRYGCINQICAHEAIVRKSSGFTERPIVAVAGLVGAALAGALLTGLGFYLASEASTRAEVRDAYTTVLQPDAAERPDAALALPVSRQLPEPKYDTASILDTNPEPGELRAEFVPPVPTFAPAADPAPPEAQH